MADPAEPGDRRPTAPDPADPARPGPAGTKSGDARRAPSRLERPPGDRYARGSASGATAPQRRPSPARGIALAGLATLGGAAVVAILAGRLNLSAGLLALAAALGWFVGRMLRLGAGASIGRHEAGWTALATAVLGIALAQVGIWLYARSEGGVLSLVDYLGQTFGWLVPMELALAAIGGWLGATPPAEGGRDAGASRPR